MKKLKAFEWDCWLNTNAVAKFKAGKLPEDSATASEMAESVLIAHGNLMESIAENKLGIRQYNTVRYNDKTDQGDCAFIVAKNVGGVQPNDWLDLFYRAVDLVTANVTHYEYLAAGYAKGTDVRFIRRM